MKNDDRVLLRSLARYGERHGLELEVFSLGWIATLSRGGRRQVVFGYDLGLNSSSVLKLCDDKAATAEVLARSGVAHVPHRLFVHPEIFPFVHVPGNWRGLLEAFEAFDRNVVVKDNNGTGGREVLLARDPATYERAVTKLFERARAVAVSPFMDLGREVRVMLLDGEPLLAYGKERPVVVGDGRASNRQLIERRIAEGELALSEDAWSAISCELGAVPAAGEVVAIQWRHNLGMGARARLYDLEGPEIAETIDLARRAQAAAGARFCSVDIAAAPDGERVMEINAGIMLENVVSWHPEGETLADRIYHAALDRIWQV
ncbi:MAG: RimK-like protein [Rhizobiales bacterium]|nr:RimK-like protein [Hyphomicrobiales bacterium]